MTKVLVQADDFSGAAEVGQQFAAHGLAARIALAADSDFQGSGYKGAQVLVVDTHSRGMSVTAAAAAVKASCGEPGAGDDRLVFKKTDSLWRGNIGAELSALTDLGYHVVLAGAMPVMGRTVVGAKPFVDGAALGSTNLWGAEATLPPADITGLVTKNTEVRIAGLDDVRSADFTAWLEATLRLSTPAIVVADGETDADLDAVVKALAALEFAAAGRPVALAGTGQIAGVLARHLGREAAHTAHSPRDAADAAGPALDAAPVLAVIGSASPAARRQLEDLSAENFEVIAINPGGNGPESDGNSGARLRAALADRRRVALTLTDSPVEPQRSAGIVARLALLAQQADQARDGQEGLRADLILTGGETARAVLDALGIRSLVPLTAVQHGAVVSEADDGRLVATKPGSFGDEHVLAQLYRAIRSHHS
ncbi:four-carbon acid sugar kinase family protein [Arthrobacter alkaliphilus]|uniref:four-carbon acid sugar kinase family protein n=1 Tax=Arthrobacter alkaliphilus TaxID=369936 RepID=UPI001F392081|nr:four-carbon acid sugar kinase family protein [Arthrobacter alkaliphilus]